MDITTGRIAYYVFYFGSITKPDVIVIRSSITSLSKSLTPCDPSTIYSLYTPSPPLKLRQAEYTSVPYLANPVKANKQLRQIRVPESPKIGHSPEVRPRKHPCKLLSWAIVKTPAFGLRDLLHQAIETSLTTCIGVEGLGRGLSRLVSELRAASFI